MKTISLAASLALILTCSCGTKSENFSSSAPSEKKLSLGPDKQRRFCEAQLYKPPVETDPVKAAQLPPPDAYAAQDKILAVMGRPGTFDNWQGTGEFEISKEGIKVTFHPNCKENDPVYGPVFGTINMKDYERYYGGIQSAPEWAKTTLIPLSSPEAQAIGRALKVDSRPSITASGTLVPVEPGFKDEEGGTMSAEPHNYYVGIIPPRLSSRVFLPPSYFVRFSKVEVVQ